MPRSSSKSGARTSSSSRPAPPPVHSTPLRSAAPPPAAPVSSVPQQTMAAPAPAPAVSSGGGGGGFLGNIGSSIMHGMASGVGFSVANRAVDAVLGPRKTEVVHRHEGDVGAAAPAAPAATSNSCGNQQQQLNDCLGRTTDISQCQPYVDLLKQCQNGGLA